MIGLLNNIFKKDSELVKSGESWQDGWQDGFHWSEKHYDIKTGATKMPEDFIFRGTSYWCGFAEGCHTNRAEKRGYLKTA